jgi:hypothetical protein
MIVMFSVVTNDTAEAATITVANLNDNGAGSLRQAIADSASDGVIEFGVSGTILLTSSKLLIAKNLTINGPTSGGVTIDGNAASEVIRIDTGNVVKLTNLTITNGRNSAGGGIINIGTLTVENSTISGNDASNGEGGGILNIGTLTLRNTTVSGNTSSAGGGVGGGISNRQGFVVNLYNSTITANSAGGAGGGIRNNDGTVRLTNTILASNTAGTNPDCTDSGGKTITSQGHNLVGDVTGCTFSTGTGDLMGTASSPIVPNLGPLQDNGGSTKTHALLTDSPAIDAGDPATPGSGGFACEPADQRGTSRPQGDACDIGAFELAPASSVPGVSAWGLVILVAIMGIAFLRKTLPRIRPGVSA